MINSLSVKFIKLQNFFIFKERCKTCLVFSLSQYPLSKLIGFIESRCSSINNIYHYSSTRTRKESVLFELSNLSSLERILSYTESPSFFSNDISSRFASEAMRISNSRKWKTIKNCNQDPMDLIDGADSLQNGLRSIVKNYSLPIEETLLRITYVKEFQKLLTDFYPDAEVDVYGSSCFGFSTVYSDLDIILKIQPTTEDSTLKTMYDVKNLLRQKDKSNTAFISLFRGKYPIINIRHNLLGCYIDISVKNIEEFNLVQESRLFYSNYFGSYHGIEDFIIILKVLFRKYRVISDGPSKYFTSFKITAIFIHFLHEMKVLDPMKYDLIRPVKFSQEYDRILIEFLEWVSKKDFSNQFISLYEGCSLNKLNLAPELRNSKDYLICLEPFKNDFKNITTNIDVNTWKQFQALCSQIRNDLVKIMDK